MTTTTKPPKRALACSTPPPLTPAEARWLQCWRRMDDRRREENLQFIELQAANHPRRRSPRLVLLVGGAE